MKISDAICNLRDHFYSGSFDSELSSLCSSFSKWADQLTISELLMYLENYGDEEPKT